MRESFRSLILLMCCLASSASNAQLSPLGLSVQIGPITAYCRDPFNNTIVNYHGPMNQAAMASVIHGGPAIAVDLQKLNSMPPAFSVFAYVHECGHHYLGHVINASANHTSELAADCYAARKIRELGWLSQNGFSSAMQVLATFPGSSTHPSGTYRAQQAQVCFSTVP